MKRNNKDSLNKQLKDLSKQNRLAHKQEVEDIVKDVQTDFLNREYDYNNAKRLNLIDYILIVLISATLVGLSFIIAIFGLKDISKTEYFTTASGAILLFTALIMGFIRNNNSAKFYNDSRRRYQPTFTEEEARNRRISKIILFTSLILLIVSIIFWIVL
ncbi:hypothetical protein [Spiroplasma culicicola]|uniref:Transmembrane protein n=1 Tax=Spiroplasma culicicola AES-1 TaxID=1276246 RepID=W6A807_9MOLU|nr:hypothetical protein [Spiroplasma culicicola]AHI53121.1 hypothetical protein SCULI_v1c07800 [Spiroplasma culicicola AES-1]